VRLELGQFCSARLTCEQPVDQEGTGRQKARHDGTDADVDEVAVVDLEADPLFLAVRQSELPSVSPAYSVPIFMYLLMQKHCITPSVFSLT